MLERVVTRLGEEGIRVYVPPRTVMSHTDESGAYCECSAHGASHRHLQLKCNASYSARLRRRTHAHVAHDDAFLRIW